MAGAGEDPDDPAGPRRRRPPRFKGEGATLRDLLQDLDRATRASRSGSSPTTGRLHRFVNLYVNEEDVRYLGSLDTDLSEGDTVSILPAVAGG